MFVDSVVFIVSDYDLLFFAGAYYAGGSGAYNKRKLYSICGDARVIDVFRARVVRIFVSRGRIAGVCRHG
jgi:hypothetical protein